MNSRRLAITLFTPVFLVCLVAAAGVLDHLRTYYPTPETESAFLKNYTPRPVIDRFRENKSFSFGSGFAAGAGRKYVTHQGGFQFHVVMRRENWLPLMNALHNDVLEQLANNGAEVVGQSGNWQVGFRFDYRINQSLGLLIISPVAVGPPARRTILLRDGMEDVTVKIEQTEKWFPKGIVRVEQKL